MLAISLCRLGPSHCASWLWQVWGRRRSKAWLQQSTTSTALEALPGILSSDQLNAVSPSWPLCEHDLESFSKLGRVLGQLLIQQHHPRICLAVDFLIMLFVSPASDTECYQCSVMANTERVGCANFQAESQRNELNHPYETGVTMLPVGHPALAGLSKPPAPMQRGMLPGQEQDRIATRGKKHIERGCPVVAAMAGTSPLPVLNFRSDRVWEAHDQAAMRHAKAAELQTALHEQMAERQRLKVWQPSTWHPTAALQCKEPEHPRKPDPDHLLLTEWAPDALPHRTYH